MSKAETAALQGAGNAKTTVCGAVSNSTTSINNLTERLRMVDQHLADNLSRLGAHNPIPQTDGGVEVDRPGDLGDLHGAICRLNAVVESIESFRSDIDSI